MTLPISRHLVSFVATDDISLPNYAGSALRGMFGHALKDMTCLTAHENRGVCRCQPLCLYRTLFDPPKGEHQGRLQDTPPPFVVEAHSLPMHIKQGQTAHFSLVLIGKMAQGERTIIELAWRRALASGFDQQGKKSSATLIGFDNQDSPKESITSANSLVIDLQTHTRIQQQGKILGEANFCIKAFCQSVLRRYALLNEIYGTEKLDLTPAYQDIENIEGKFNLYRHHWARYSNRQRQKITQDGVIGTIELSNISEQLYLYLYLGQWLHVGKGNVFGLGQYQIR